MQKFCNPDIYILASHGCEHIKLFQDKKIRSVWNDEEEQWYFVVGDVVAALTDSVDPKQYVKRMKLRDAELAKGWVQIVPTLVVPTFAGQ